MFILKQKITVILGALFVLVSTCTLVTVWEKLCITVSCFVA